MSLQPGSSSASESSSTSLPGGPSPMIYARTYADANGESHFDDVTPELNPVEFIPGEAPVSLSANTPTVAAVFCHVPGSWPADWHPCPRRQFAITIAGEAEVRTTDGSVRRFLPGDVWLMEDTTGKGHHTVPVGDLGWSCVLLPLSDEG